MIDRILEVYRQEMSQILPYKFDWYGSLMAIGTMALCVLGVVVGMLAIAGML